MDDFAKEALALVKSQAAVRPMTEDDIVGMVASLAGKLRALCEGKPVEAEPAPVVLQEEEDVKPVMDPKASIKEKSVTCLVCGKVFKVLTKKHLALHGMDAKEYRAAFGLKKGTALTCKELQRMRRAKMKDMKLWEKKAAAKAMKEGAAK